jgi:hypothetical protein
MSEMYVGTKFVKYSGSGVVKALCYKPEGRGFDIRRGDFKFT